MDVANLPDQIIGHADPGVARLILKAFDGAKRYQGGTLACGLLKAEAKIAGIGLVQVAIKKLTADERFKLKEKIGGRGHRVRVQYMLRAPLPPDLIEWQMWAFKVMLVPWAEHEAPLCEFRDLTWAMEDWRGGLADAPWIAPATKDGGLVAYFMALEDWRDCGPRR